MLPPIVDAHLHFRDAINNPYEALHDAVDENGVRQGKPATSYLPRTYLGDAAELHLAGFIHVEAEWDHLDPVGESRWLQTLSASNEVGGLPFVAIGFADLSRPDVAPVLQEHAEYSVVRGIRQILNRIDGRPDLCWADREYLDDPLWRTNYRLLGRFGLDFDLMCFSHQMLPMARLAAENPSIPVHLEHAGLPWDHRPEGRETWRRGMRALAALPHVDVKISGLGNTIPEWTVESIRRYVLDTIDIFGPDRVMFASNFPTDKAFSDMATVWNAFDILTEDFSVAERNAMFSDNAFRQYRFEPRRLGEAASVEVKP